MSSQNFAPSVSSPPPSSAAHSNRAYRADPTLSFSSSTSAQEPNETHQRQTKDNKPSPETKPSALDQSQFEFEDDDATTLDGSRDEPASMELNEHSPLLGDATNHHPARFVDSSSTNSFRNGSNGNWRSIPKSLSSALIGTIRVIFATIAAPCRYVIACFYDEEGQFSPLLPFLTIYHVLTPRKKRKVPASGETEKSNSSWRIGKDGMQKEKRSKRALSVASTSTAVASDSEADEKSAASAENEHSSSKSHFRSSSARSSMSSSGDDVTPSRRSIRIKLHNDEILKRRREQEFQNQTSSKVEDVKAAVAASLKSPSNPGNNSTLSASKLRFPRSPTPPRPLIPRRQPSYTAAGKLLTSSSRHNLQRKTLIIDLDETLIHSHSKGGRFATGHMVEVKMQHAVGVGGTIIGPQIPILYYVHKRPHCDEFLRKVSKWYNLVIFTASVQEYADPVIDWLELERSYFSGRYYRQHCTHRNGAYIKDLSQVEPDLSRVMIVDNSPVSYVFHEDNAIPIEGWISDPTDNDLLNLVPLLEGLQHCTDVRALLALRLGQPKGMEGDTETATSSEMGAEEHGAVA